MSWLDIIGIGEDGVDGLCSEAKAALEAAEVIIGGDRHHNLTPKVTAQRLNWPSPFNAMIDEINALRGRKLAILVTGDPLWYSVGARIARAIPAKEIRFHPQLSAFQWAATRLGWSLADCDTLTIHGRADSQILPYLAPRVKLLVLTQNADSPGNVARLLKDRGFGDSKITVLAALGGPHEKRFDGTAHDWAISVPDFHTLAIECVADVDAQWFARTGGLPDHAFVHDGQITKQELRASTIAKLAPYADAVLWDIGAGCGSVSIEWMRAARSASAIAFEHNTKRLDMIKQNAIALGAEKIQLVDGKAPQTLQSQPQPDAIFIGGGLTTPSLFETAWAQLRRGGVLVSNAVTLESETRLAQLHQQFGGELVRITVQSAQPVGAYRGWRSNMPVTQWCVRKTDVTAP